METKRCNFFRETIIGCHDPGWIGRRWGREKPIDHLRRSINRKKKPHRAESTRRHGECARDAIKLAACATDVVRDERAQIAQNCREKVDRDAREKKRILSIMRRGSFMREPVTDYRRVN